jgi:hypothetical protein
MLLCIHPLPYFEQEYSFKVIDMLITKSKYVEVKYMLGDFLFAFMFLRFYFVIRTLMNFSNVSDLSSKKICKKHNFESNTSFCFKAFFKKHHSLTIFGLAFFSIMWLSYLLRIFEK